MSDYSVEEENLRAVKQFWQKNHLWIMSTVVTAAVLFFGIQYYQYNKQVKTEQASAVYMQMLRSDEIGDLVAANTHGQDIIDQYGSTSYASLAKFIMARYAIAQGQIEDAKNYYSEIIDSKHKHWHSLAAIRLASVELAQQNFDRAREALGKVDGDEYQTMVHEILGDIAFAQGDGQTAVNEYKESLISAEKLNMNRPLVIIKLQDLGVEVRGGRRG